MASLPITAVKGIGDAAAHKLAILGIHTTEDLLEYYPRRYEDYSVVTPISKLEAGMVTICAKITSPKGRYVRRAMHITEAAAVDDSGGVRVVWFNQPYRANTIKADELYFISGDFQMRSGRLSILNPSIELVSDFPVNAARILPVYRETKGLTSKQIRKYVYQTITNYQIKDEMLPSWLVKEEHLIDRHVAVDTMHFPESNKALDIARKRLGFEEVFVLTLASLLNKQELLHDTSIAIPFNKDFARTFVENLPFELTNAQRRVIWDIYKDMQRTQPMNRLVEGDVGSGKTVVAAMASLMPMSEGFQVAIMAPTELLARQHADTFYALLKPLDLHESVALLVGGMSASEKQAVYERVSSGAVKCVIGTHALIQESVDMKKLGLVIIDEQHRFGVDQRKKLMAKAGHMPHLLSLTATPIPRSLALTLYGELDVSIIDAKPAGRQPTTTEICSPNSRKQLYTAIDEELTAGRQMFVVCPLISESSSVEAFSAEQVYELFITRDFKHRRVGLLHGKMKAQEKNDIMDQFARHELDILVSTTVIEVGVDVPNASIMLIEAAERFGLAQMHQLRGRVGRGGHKGYCYLMMSSSQEPPRRLRALEQSHDGFKLAELDLELRGPGAIYGTMQHGQLDLRVAKITDLKLIATARHAAQEYIDREENLLQYPQLLERVQSVRAVTNLN